MKISSSKRRTKKEVKYKKFAVASFLICKQDYMALGSTSTCRDRDYSIVLGNSDLDLSDVVSDSSNNYMVLAGKVNNANASFVVNLDINSCEATAIVTDDISNGVSSVHVDKNGANKFVMAGLSDSNF